MIGLGQEDEDDRMRMRGWGLDDEDERMRGWGRKYEDEKMRTRGWGWMTRMEDEDGWWGSMMRVNDEDGGWGWEDEDERMRIRKILLFWIVWKENAGSMDVFTWSRRIG